MDHNDSEKHPLDRGRLDVSSKPDHRSHRYEDNVSRPFIESTLFLHQEALDIVDGIRSSNSKTRTVSLLPAIEESQNEDKEDFGLGESRSASSILSRRLFFPSRVSCKPALTSISEERLSRFLESSGHGGQNDSDILVRRSKRSVDDAKKALGFGYGDVAAGVRERIEELELAPPEKMPETAPQNDSTPLLKSPRVAQAGGEGMVAYDDRACDDTLDDRLKLYECETQLRRGHINDSEHDYSNNCHNPEPGEDLHGPSVSTSQEEVTASHEFSEAASPLDPPHSSDMYQVCSGGPVLNPAQVPMLTANEPNIAEPSCARDYRLQEQTEQEFYSLEETDYHDNDNVLKSTENDKEDLELSLYWKHKTASNSCSCVKGSGFDSVVNDATPGSGDLITPKESHSEHTTTSASSDRQDKDLKDCETKKSRVKDSAGKQRGRERERNKRKKDRDDRANSTGKKKWLLNIVGERAQNESMEGSKLCDTAQAKIEAEDASQVIFVKLMEKAKSLELTERSEDVGDVKERNIKSTCGLESQTVTAIIDPLTHDSSSAQRNSNGNDTENGDEWIDEKGTGNLEPCKSPNNRLGKRTVHRQKHSTGGFSHISCSPEQSITVDLSTQDHEKDSSDLIDNSQLEEDMFSKSAVFDEERNAPYRELQACKSLSSDTKLKGSLCAPDRHMVSVDVVYNESFNHPPKYLEDNHDTAEDSNVGGGVDNEDLLSEDLTKLNQESRDLVDEESHYAFHEEACHVTGLYETEVDEDAQMKYEFLPTDLLCGLEENVDVSEYITAQNTGFERAELVCTSGHLNEMSDPLLANYTGEEDKSYYEIQCHADVLEASDKMDLVTENILVGEDSVDGHEYNGGSDVDGSFLLPASHYFTMKANTSDSVTLKEKRDDFRNNTTEERKYQITEDTYKIENLSYKISLFTKPSISNELYVVNYSEEEKMKMNNSGKTLACDRLRSDNEENMMTSGDQVTEAACTRVHERKAPGKEELNYQVPDADGTLEREHVLVDNQNKMLPENNSGIENTQISHGARLAYADQIHWLDSMSHRETLQTFFLSGQSFRSPNDNEGLQNHAPESLMEVHGVDSIHSNKYFTLNELIALQELGFIIENKNYEQDYVTEYTEQTFETGAVQSHNPIIKNNANEVEANIEDNGSQETRYSTSDSLCSIHNMGVTKEVLENVTNIVSNAPLVDTSSSDSLGAIFKSHGASLDVTQLQGSSVDLVDAIGTTDDQQAKKISQISTKRYMIQRIRLDPTVESLDPHSDGSDVNFALASPAKVDDSQESPLIQELRDTFGETKKYQPTDAREATVSQDNAMIRDSEDVVHDDHTMAAKLERDIMLVKYAGSNVDFDQIDTDVDGNTMLASVKSPTVDLSRTVAEKISSQEKLNNIGETSEVLEDKVKIDVTNGGENKEFLDKVNEEAILSSNKESSMTESVESPNLDVRKNDDRQDDAREMDLPFTEHVQEKIEQVEINKPTEFEIPFTPTNANDVECARFNALNINDKNDGEAGKSINTAHEVVPLMTSRVTGPAIKEVSDKVHFTATDSYKLNSKADSRTIQHNNGELVEEIMDDHVESSICTNQHVPITQNSQLIEEKGKSTLGGFNNKSELLETNKTFIKENRYEVKNTINDAENVEEIIIGDKDVNLEKTVMKIEETKFQTDEANSGLKYEYVGLTRDDNVASINCKKFEIFNAHPAQSTSSRFAAQKESSIDVWETSPDMLLYSDVDMSPTIALDLTLADVAYTAPAYSRSLLFMPAAMSEQQNKPLSEISLIKYQTVQNDKVISETNSTEGHSIHGNKPFSEMDAQFSVDSKREPLNQSRSDVIDAEGAVLDLMDQPELCQVGDNKCFIDDRNVAEVSIFTVLLPGDYPPLSHAEGYRELLKKPDEPFAAKQGTIFAGSNFVSDNKEKDCFLECVAGKENILITDNVKGPHTVNDDVAMCPESSPLDLTHQENMASVMPILKSDKAILKDNNKEKTEMLLSLHETKSKDRGNFEEEFNFIYNDVVKIMTAYDDDQLLTPYIKSSQEHSQGEELSTEDTSQDLQTGGSFTVDVNEGSKALLYETSENEMSGEQSLDFLVKASQESIDLVKENMTIHEEASGNTISLTKKHNDITLHTNLQENVIVDEACEMKDIDTMYFIFQKEVGDRKGNENKLEHAEMKENACDMIFKDEAEMIERATKKIDMLISVELDEAARSVELDDDEQSQSMYRVSDEKTGSIEKDSDDRDESVEDNFDDKPESIENNFDDKSESIEKYLDEKTGIIENVLDETDESMEKDIDEKNINEKTESNYQTESSENYFEEMDRPEEKEMAEKIESTLNDIEENSEIIENYVDNKTESVEKGINDNIESTEKKFDASDLTADFNEQRDGVSLESIKKDDEQCKNCIKKELDGTLESLDKGLIQWADSIDDNQIACLSKKKEQSVDKYAVTVEKFEILNEHIDNIRIIDFSGKDQAEMIASIDMDHSSLSGSYEKNPNEINEYTLKDCNDFKKSIVTEHEEIGNSLEIYSGDIIESIEKDFNEISQSDKKEIDEKCMSRKKYLVDIAQSGRDDVEEFRDSMEVYNDISKSFERDHQEIVKATEKSYCDVIFKADETNNEITQLTENDTEIYESLRKDHKDISESIKKQHTEVSESYEQEHDEISGLYGKVHDVIYESAENEQNIISVSGEKKNEISESAKDESDEMSESVKKKNNEMYGSYEKEHDEMSESFDKKYDEMSESTDKEISESVDKEYDNVSESTKKDSDEIYYSHKKVRDEMSESIDKDLEEILVDKEHDDMSESVDKKYDVYESAERDGNEISNLDKTMNDEMAQSTENDPDAIFKSSANNDNDLSLSAEKDCVIISNSVKIKHAETAKVVVNVLVELDEVVKKDCIEMSESLEKYHGEIAGSGDNYHFEISESVEKSKEEFSDSIEENNDLTASTKKDDDEIFDLHEKRHGDSAVSGENYHEEILDSAEKDYVEISESAEKDYQEILELAEKEYNEILESAEKNYDEILELAEKDYTKILVSAEKDYNEILDSAEKDYNKISDSAEKDFVEILELAEKDYNEISESAEKDYTDVSELVDKSRYEILKSFEKDQDIISESVENIHDETSQSDDKCSVNMCESLRQYYDETSEPVAKARFDISESSEKDQEEFVSESVHKDLDEIARSVEKKFDEITMSVDKVSHSNEKDCNESDQSTEKDHDEITGSLENAHKEMFESVETGKYETSESSEIDNDEMSVQAEQHGDTISESSKKDVDETSKSFKIDEILDETSERYQDKTTHSAQKINDSFEKEKEMTELASTENDKASQSDVDERTKSEEKIYDESSQLSEKSLVETTATEDYDEYEFDVDDEKNHEGSSISVRINDKETSESNFKKLEENSVMERKPDAKEDDSDLENNGELSISLTKNPNVSYELVKFDQIGYSGVGASDLLGCQCYNIEITAIEESANYEINILEEKNIFYTGMKTLDNFGAMDNSKSVALRDDDDNRTKTRTYDDEDDDQDGKMNYEESDQQEKYHDSDICDSEKGGNENIEENRKQLSTSVNEKDNVDVADDNDYIEPVDDCKYMPTIKNEKEEYYCISEKVRLKNGESYDDHNGKSIDKAHFDTLDNEDNDKKKTVGDIGGEKSHTDAVEEKDECNENKDYSTNVDYKSDLVDDVFGEKDDEKYYSVYSLGEKAKQQSVDENHDLAEDKDSLFIDEKKEDSVVYSGDGANEKLKVNEENDIDGNKTLKEDISEEIVDEYDEKHSDSNSDNVNETGESDRIDSKMNATFDVGDSDVPDTSSERDSYEVDLSESNDDDDEIIQFDDKENYRKDINEILELDKKDDVKLKVVQQNNINVMEQTEIVETFESEENYPNEIDNSEESNTNVISDSEEKDQNEIHDFKDENPNEMVESDGKDSNEYDHFEEKDPDETNESEQKGPTEIDVSDEKYPNEMDDLKKEVSEVNLEVIEHAVKIDLADTKIPAHPISSETSVAENDTTFSARSSESSQVESRNECLEKNMQMMALLTGSDDATIVCKQQASEFQNVVNNFNQTTVFPKTLQESKDDIQRDFMKIDIAKVEKDALLQTTSIINIGILLKPVDCEQSECNSTLLGELSHTQSIEELGELIEDHGLAGSSMSPDMELAVNNSHLQCNTTSPGDRVDADANIVDNAFEQEAYILTEDVADMSNEAQQEEFEVMLDVTSYTRPPCYEPDRTYEFSSQLKADDNEAINLQDASYGITRDERESEENTSFNPAQPLHEGLDSSVNIIYQADSFIYKTMEEHKYILLKKLPEPYLSSTYQQDLPLQQEQHCYEGDMTLKQKRLYYDNDINLENQQVVQQNMLSEVLDYDAGQMENKTSPNPKSPVNHVFELDDFTGDATNEVNMSYVTELHEFSGEAAQSLKAAQAGFSELDQLNYLTTEQWEYSDTTQLENQENAMLGFPTTTPLECPDAVQLDCPENVQQENFPIAQQEYGTGQIECPDNAQLATVKLKFGECEQSCLDKDQHNKDKEVHYSNADGEDTVNEALALDNNEDIPDNKETNLSSYEINYTGEHGDHKDSEYSEKLERQHLLGDSDLDEDDTSEHDQSLSNEMERGFVNEGFISVKEDNVFMRLENDLNADKLVSCETTTKQENVNSLTNKTEGGGNGGLENEVNIVGFKYTISGTDQSKLPESMPTEREQFYNNDGCNDDDGNAVDKDNTGDLLSREVKQDSTNQQREVIHSLLAAESNYKEGYTCGEISKDNATEKSQPLVNNKHYTLFFDPIVPGNEDQFSTELEQLLDETNGKQSLKSNDGAPHIVIAKDGAKALIAETNGIQPLIQLEDEPHLMEEFKGSQPYEDDLFPGQKDWESGGLSEKQLDQFQMYRDMLQTELDLVKTSSRLKFEGNEVEPIEGSPLYDILDDNNTDMKMPAENVPQVPTDSYHISSLRSEGQHQQIYTEPSSRQLCDHSSALDEIRHFKEIHHQILLLKQMFCNFQQSDQMFNDIQRAKQRHYESMSFEHPFPEPLSDVMNVSERSNVEQSERFFDENQLPELLFDKGLIGDEIHESEHVEDQQLLTQEANTVKQSEHTEDEQQLQQVIDFEQMSQVQSSDSEFLESKQLRQVCDGTESEVAGKDNILLSDNQCRILKNTSMDSPDKAPTGKTAQVVVERQMVDSEEPKLTVPASEKTLEHDSDEIMETLEKCVELLTNYKEHEVDATVQYVLKLPSKDSEETTPDSADTEQRFFDVQLVELQPDESHENVIDGTCFQDYKVANEDQLAIKGINDPEENKVLLKDTNFYMEADIVHEENIVPLDDNFLLEDIQMSMEVEILLNETDSPEKNTLFSLDNSKWSVFHASIDESKVTGEGNSFYKDAKWTKEDGADIDESHCDDRNKVINDVNNENAWIDSDCVDIEKIDDTNGKSDDKLVRNDNAVRDGAVDSDNAGLDQTMDSDYVDGGKLNTNDDAGQNGHCDDGNVCGDEQADSVDADKDVDNDADDVDRKKLIESDNVDRKKLIEVDEDVNTDKSDDLINYYREKPVNSDSFKDKQLEIDDDVNDVEKLIDDNFDIDKPIDIDRDKPMDDGADIDKPFDVDDVERDKLILVDDRGDLDESNVYADKPNVSEDKDRLEDSDEHVGAGEKEYHSAPEKPSTLCKDGAREAESDITHVGHTLTWILDQQHNEQRPRLERQSSRDETDLQCFDLINSDEILDSLDQWSATHDASLKDIPHYPNQHATPLAHPTEKRLNKEDLEIVHGDGSHVPLLDDTDKDDEIKLTSILSSQEEIYIPRSGAEDTQRLVSESDKSLCEFLLSNAPLQDFENMLGADGLPLADPNTLYIGDGRTEDKPDAYRNEGLMEEHEEGNKVSAVENEVFETVLMDKDEENKPLIKETKDGRRRVKKGKQPQSSTEIAYNDSSVSGRSARPVALKTKSADECAYSRAEGFMEQGQVKVLRTTKSSPLSSVNVKRLKIVDIEDYPQDAPCMYRPGDACPSLTPSKKKKSTVQFNSVRSVPKRSSTRPRKKTSLWKRLKTMLRAPRFTRRDGKFRFVKKVKKDSHSAQMSTALHSKHLTTDSLDGKCEGEMNTDELKLKFSHNETEAKACYDAWHSSPSSKPCGVKSKAKSKRNEWRQFRRLRLLRQSAEMMGPTLPPMRAHNVSSKNYVRMYSEYHNNLDCQFQNLAADKPRAQKRKKRKTKSRTCKNSQSPLLEHPKENVTTKRCEMANSGMPEVFEIFCEDDDDSNEVKEEATVRMLMKPLEVKPSDSQTGDLPCSSTDASNENDPCSHVRELGQVHKGLLRSPASFWRLRCVIM